MDGFSHGLAEIAGRGLSLRWLPACSPGVAFRRVVDVLAAVEIDAEEVQRLERMLASLRKMQLPAPRAAPLALRMVVDRAVTLVGTDPARVQRARVEVPEGVIVTADADALLQIFANLLRNAAQASGPHGAIGVTALPERCGWRVEIWDDGPGFRAEFAERLFRAWYSSRSDGTGLGIAITYRLVRGSGWTLKAERREARTVFSLGISAEQAQGAAA